MVTGGAHGKTMRYQDKAFFSTLVSSSKDLSTCTSSSCPFIKLKVLELQSRCDHATFGIESAECADLTQAYIANMLPNSTGAGILGWRWSYARAYIVELNKYPVFNTEDFIAACLRAGLSHTPAQNKNISYCGPGTKRTTEGPRVLSSSPYRPMSSCYKDNDVHLT
jgi:hypothetical protein